MEETLGKRIAFHRKRLGLTQDALAEKLGVTAQAVSKWENDQSCPDITTLPKLAEIFDVTTDELLGVQKKTVPAPDAISELPLPEQPTQEPASTARDTLTSPSAAFALWLVLTGIVATIDIIRDTPCDFADIAIAAGVFVFGLCGFLRNFSILRFGCAIGGGFFLLQFMFDASIAGISWKLPLAIGFVLLGLDLLANAARRPKHSRWGISGIHHVVKDAQINHFHCEEGRFSCITNFGKNNIPVQLPVLSEGSAEVSFGSMTVDLTACEDLTVPCPVQLECSFGELIVLVPRRYRTELLVSTAFASVEEIGTSDPDAEKTITLSCDASFGHIIIRHI